MVSISFRKEKPKKNKNPAHHYHNKFSTFSNNKILLWTAIIPAFVLVSAGLVSATRNSGRGNSELPKPDTTLKLETTTGNESTGSASIVEQDITSDLNTRTDSNGQISTELKVNGQDIPIPSGSGEVHRKFTDGNNNQTSVDIRVDNNSSSSTNDNDDNDGSSRVRIRSDIDTDIRIRSSSP